MWFMAAALYRDWQSDVTMSVSSIFLERPQLELIFLSHVMDLYDCKANSHQQRDQKSNNGLSFTVILCGSRVKKSLCLIQSAVEALVNPPCPDTHICKTVNLLPWVTYSKSRPWVWHMCLKGTLDPESVLQGSAGPAHRGQRQGIHSRQDTCLS